MPPMAGPVLLIAACWRTNLTMRQIEPLFGMLHSAAHQVIHKVGPLLALAVVRKRRVDSVAIVDRTLVSTRDHYRAIPTLKSYETAFSAAAQAMLW